MESDEETEDWNKPFELRGSTDITNTDDDFSFTSGQVGGSHKRVILHIDIDCFYAQVEMIRNPELRNKPLGIQQKYIVVTCNYPARAQGVTKLMTIKDAKEKCPSLVLVSGEDLTNYREMSYKISGYLQKYCPLVERLGFDENFLDITEMVNDRLCGGQQGQVQVKGHVYQSESVEDTCGCGCHQRLPVGSNIAADIREGLYTDLGITCCGGVAHNKLLSKLVAGIHKPNQQTTLFPEQTTHLLGQLPSVRNIPGIGHTTAKRLREIGVVTISDLQNVDSSVLEEEFGAVTTATMKNLSIGVDDAEVVAYGLPQTLSDEDSFKKCCTLTDARSRIKQLLLSLLKRLFEDGRLPHTFRLTVRKMSAANKYMNRESRQCNIPSTVFNKFSAENLHPACEQLETLSTSLLTKMVDTKQAFHLTLINVAFAKLEQKSSNAITNFFSPRKQDKINAIPTQDSDTNLNTSITHQNVEISEGTCQSSFPADSHRQRNTQGVSIMQDTGKEVTGKEKYTLDKYLAQSPLKSPKNMKLTVPKIDLSENEVNSSKGLHGANSNTQVIGKWEDDVKPCGSLISASLKRRIDRYTEESLNDTKRLKTEEINISKSNNSATVKSYNDLLTVDIDVEVLKQLPTDIQCEILKDMGKSSRTNIRLSADIDKSCNENEGDNYMCEVTSKSEPRGKHTSRGKDVEKDGIKTSSFFKVYKRQSLQTPVSNSSPTSSQISNLHNLSDESSSSNIDTNMEGATSKHTLEQQATASSSDVEKDIQVAASNQTVDVIPPGIDKSVFITLPLEIQRELINDWKTKVNKSECKSASSVKTTNKTKVRKSPSNTTSVKVSSSKSPNFKYGVKTPEGKLSMAKNTLAEESVSESTPHFKMPKPSSANNILSYFSKTNKKM